MVGFFMARRLGLHDVWATLKLQKLYFSLDLTSVSGQTVFGNPIIGPWLPMHFA